MKLMQVRVRPAKDGLNHSVKPRERKTTWHLNAPPDRRPNTFQRDMQLIGSSVQYFFHHHSSPPLQNPIHHRQIHEGLPWWLVWPIGPAPNLRRLSGQRL